MKSVLAASALAIIATSAQAQTTTPQPAPGPIAVTKSSPAPRQQTRRTIARKRVNPMVRASLLPIVQPRWSHRHRAS